MDRPLLPTLEMPLAKEGGRDQRQEGSGAENTVGMSQADVWLLLGILLLSLRTAENCGWVLK